MRKPLTDRSQGGGSPQHGFWAKTFRYFYAAEAKAVGMPVDQFLDLVGDRLEERGQRPKHFRRELRSLWRERWETSRMEETEVREDFMGIDSIA